MTQNNFDPIIDDCFLDSAARVNAKKYERKINLRAAEIISKLITGKGSGVKYL